MAEIARVARLEPRGDAGRTAALRLDELRKGEANDGTPGRPGRTTGDLNNPTTENPEVKPSKWKRLVKKFGIGGIIFFTVKGIITSTLIFFLGKNFWTIIKEYFAAWFQ